MSGYVVASNSYSDSKLSKNHTTASKKGQKTPDNCALNLVTSQLYRGHMGFVPKMSWVSAIQSFMFNSSFLVREIDDLSNVIADVY